jgi:glycosyltransferase involved in cell wall biosynthesis
MKVSVVIPVYNEEEYLEHCLESLMNQEEKPDEIIIVDNNSTDRSMEIARQYPVRIILERQQGTSYARNAGFNAAQNEIIVRCDADTRPPPSWIKRIKENFADAQIDALVGRLIFYDVSFPFRHLVSWCSLLFLFSMRTILGHYILDGPNSALRQEMWQRVKNLVCMDNTRVHEDIDLAIHINENHGHIVYDPTFEMYVSSRRMRYHPKSFFIEYPWRMLKMLHHHRQNSKKRSIV